MTNPSETVEWLAARRPMTTIRKVELKLTLLLEDSDRARLDHMSLEEIANEMDEGSFIGMTSIMSDTIVPPSNVKDALLDLGNDGTFFDEDWDDEL